jgi:riboflavin kinase/FMN adenylyltransferase
MTTPAQRAALMAREGIGQVLILPFTPALAQLSPQEFVSRILVDRLAARAVLVGENFRFGHRQEGDVRLLGELGRRYGFYTEIIPAIVVRGRMVSSSAIREAIGAGEVSRAGRLLRSPFALEGAVVRGRGVGSKQTVPTLNLAPRSEVLPAHGVYITCTREIDGGRLWPSITNVGRRPTFDGGDVTVETYLLEPLEGESPAEIRVEFLRRLREERKFENPEALKVQILRDVGRAQAFFRRWRKQPSATLRDSVR